MVARETCSGGKVDDGDSAEKGAKIGEGAIVVGDEVDALCPGARGAFEGERYLCS